MEDKGYRPYNKNHLFIRKNIHDRHKSSKHVIFTWRARSTASAKAELVSFDPVLFDFWDEVLTLESDIVQTAKWHNQLQRVEVKVSFLVLKINKNYIISFM